MQALLRPGARNRQALMLGAVAVASVGIALLLYATEVAHEAELSTVDARFSIHGEQKPPEDVVMVLIDDTTSNELDIRFPYPRSLHARVIDAISAGGPKAIAYDVEFIEPTTPRQDNALITAAEIVRRLVAFRPNPNLDDLWQARLDSLDLPDEVRTALSDPATIDDAIAALPPAYARIAHACSHTTISPNVIHGGQKTNTIPDVIDMDVDIRTVPGDTKEVVDGYLAEALGDLADRVEVSTLQACEPTRSPIDNPLWDALRARTQVAYPGAELVPGIITGGTDARFYRDKGSVAYGAALFSPSVTFEQFGSRFHGNDERIDVESLGMSTDFWYHIAKHVCG